MTTEEIYTFVETTMQKCRQVGHVDIAQQLDDAVHLGSSGLEILGAIKLVLNSNAARLEKVVDMTQLEEVVDSIDRAFGIK